MNDWSNAGFEALEHRPTLAGRGFQDYLALNYKLGRPWWRVEHLTVAESTQNKMRLL